MPATTTMQSTTVAELAVHRASEGISPTRERAREREDQHSERARERRRISTTRARAGEREDRGRKEADLSRRWEPRKRLGW
eukprot:2327755-Rhodomonas_salina.1